MADHLTETQVKNLPVKSYEEIRPQLASGDLFFASGDYMVSKAIKHFTNSPWSHVGIVFDVKEFDRVLLLESVEDVGVRFAPISKYLTDYDNGQPYKGILVFARSKATAQAGVVTSLAAFGCNQLTLPYDKEEIGYIVARIALKIGKRPERHGYICSELVYECFRSAGHQFAHNDDFVAPEDIWKDASVELVARVR